MSFSFRNIFNPEDGDPEGAASQAGGDMRHQASFSSPDGSARKPPPSQAFLVSELLPFIPPAIAAQTGIPMTREVEIPVSADGSNDVLLSTLYQVCPELFAAEITPLNESTVTLPAKLSSIPEPGPEGKSPFAPGTAFSKPPGMASTPSAPAKAAPEPASGKSNPFWSPEEGEEAPVAKEQPLNDMSEPHPQQRAASSSAESNKPKGLGEGGDAQGKGASPSPFGSGAPAPKVPDSQVPDALANGFSAPAQGGANPFEQKGPAAKDNLPAGQVPSSDSKFSANPFESEEGYSTLFSSQAEKDSAIPFPSSSPKPAEPKQTAPQPEKAEEGSWGTMFDAKPDSETAPGSSDVGNGFESIGNLIPGSLKSPATPTPAGGSSFGSPDNDKDDDDYGLFLPPIQEEHELPAAFQVESPAPETQEEVEAEVPADDIDRPSFGFEPAAQPIPQGFSAAKSEPETPAPVETPAPAAQAPADPAPEPSAAFASPTPAPVERAPKAASTAAQAPADPTPEPSAAFASPTPAPAPVERAPEAASTPAPAPASEPSVRALGSAFSGNAAPVNLGKPKVDIELAQKPAPEPAPQPKVAPEPEPEPLEIPAATSMAIPGLSPSVEIRDLELRAIFSTSDAFTLRSVARRVVALPGIASCALATPGRLVQASRNEESRIGDEAKEMVETIRNLAKLTGLPDAQTFTLQTDRGIVSLFLYGECCLTVHHESAEFEPGIREKLILVSRNLEKLEK